MAPSRGRPQVPSPKDADNGDDDVAVQQQSNSALVSAKRNFNYLISPNSPNIEKPARFRTRALLQTFRYISQFIIWRLVRWAKYVAVGALVAAIGATAFGGVISGVAWLAAPTSIGASIVAASVWGVGKYAARRLHRRWKNAGGDVGEAIRERVEDEGSIQRGTTYGIEMAPRAAPW